MTINQTFGEWELITDEPGDEIYWEHLPSGTRMEFRPDGTMASPAVQTESLANVADIVVSDGDDIDQAFTDISQGDTMIVSKPPTPYRNEEWLEPEVDGFNIVFQSRFAEDGQPIVKCADGANVGGIRVGNDTTRKDFRIYNFGFHGNADNQTGGESHNAITVSDGQMFEIDGVYATRTHPYHEHNTGGSGVECLSPSKHYAVRNCDFFDIGDQGVQAEGEKIIVENIRNIQGYDRTVTTGPTPSDSIGVTIRNIFADTIEDGSVVGAAGQNVSIDSVIALNPTRGAVKIPAVGSPKNYNINNIFVKQGRGAIRVRGDVENVNISNVVEVAPDTSQTPSASIRLGEGSNIMINNHIVDSPDFNLYSLLTNGATDVMATNLHNNGGGIIKNGSVGIRNLQVENAMSFDPNGNINHSIWLIKGPVENVRLSSVYGESTFRGVTLKANDPNGSFRANDILMNITDGDVGLHHDMTLDSRLENFETIVNGTTNGEVDVVSGAPVINGEAEESANAESPQNDYPIGTLVRFTDSGDGSGTGTFLVARDGSTVQVSSSV
jgi:hypothetical protein